MNRIVHRVWHYFLGLNASPQNELFEGLEAKGKRYVRELKEDLEAGLKNS